MGMLYIYMFINIYFIIYIYYINIEELSNRCMRNIKIIYNLLYKFQIENNITNYDNIIIDSKNINNDIEIYKKNIIN